MSADAAGTFLTYEAADKPGNVSVACTVVGQATFMTVITVTEALAQGGPPEIYGATARTLVLLFALAVVLESALDALFRWRPFVELLNPRAVRPLVAVLFAWFFVAYYQLDIVTSLVNAGSTGTQWTINGVGQFITSLVLAGGSAGINSLLVALGWCQVVTPETARPRPNADKAWIAVRAIRKEAGAGDIHVFIGKEEQLADGKTWEAPYAGTIKGVTGSGFKAYFTRDAGRFLNYGGYEVKADEEIKVMLVGPKKDGAINEPRAVWGPHRPASRAIIDIDLDI